MFRKTALLAAVCLLPLSQASAESWFEVEVFLFERNQPSAEVWPETPRQPNVAKGRDLISPVLLPAPDPSMVPCSAEERLLDSLRCDALDLQIAALHPEYPKPFPVTVAASGPAQASPGAGAVLMDKSHLQFKDAIYQLNREPGIKPLLHLSWQQAMEPRHASVPVRLFAGQDFSDRFVASGGLIPPKQPMPELLPEQSDTTDSEPGQTPQVPGDGSKPQVNTSPLASLLDGSTETNSALRETRPEPVWQLDGLLNIYLSHYLYIETNLMLRSPGTHKVVQLAETDPMSDRGSNDETTQITDKSQQQLQAPTAQEPEVIMEEQPFLYSIPLVQNRRVRSGQVHYFDHPKLGMIIQIRKMNQPEGAVDVEEPAPESEGDDTPSNDVINNQQGAQSQPQD